VPFFGLDTPISRMFRAQLPELFRLRSIAGADLVVGYMGFATSAAMAWW